MLLLFMRGGNGGGRGVNSRNAAADKLDARGGAKSTRKRFGYCIVRIVR